MLKYSGWGAGGASPQIRGGSCCTSLSPGTMAQGGLCPSAFLRYRMQHLSCFGTSRSRSLGSRTAKTTARPICEGRRSAVAAATKAAKLRKMRVLSNARVMRALSKTACFAQLCDPARRQPRAIRSKGGAHVRCSSDSRNAAASSAAGRVVRHPRAATAGAAER